MFRDTHIGKPEPQLELGLVVERKLSVKSC